MRNKIILSLLAAATLFAPSVTHAAVTKGPFSFDQASFDFYYTQGEAQPTHQSITYTNTSSSTIYYRISVPNQPSWLNTSYTTDSDLPAYANTPSGLGALPDTTGLSVGTYTTHIYLSGNFSNSPIDIPVTLRVYASGTALPSSTVHPEGTNVKTSDGTVYRISGGTRTPYTSSGAFLSYGYNSWSTVVDANAADLALLTGTCTPSAESAPRPCYIQPRDGALINDHGTIYIISDGYRQGFANAEAFLGLGYTFSSALPGDTSFLLTLAPINSSQIAHPSGTVVNANGTICVVSSPFKTGKGVARRCFSTLADMNSWGIRNFEILTANSYDLQIGIDGIISARTAYSPMNP